MVVTLGENVYEMSAGLFDNTVELAIRSNSSRYFIYCLCSKDIYQLANEKFDDEDSFVNCLKSYIKEGIDVYFIKAGERCVEYAEE